LRNYKLKKTHFTRSKQSKDASVGGLFHANRSAPACVNFTKVPLSCITSHPRSIASLRPALYSAGVALSSNSIGRLSSSMWIRPSCTASTALAISISLRAAVSGLA
jgi:hypothetical protein